jgi:peptidoglycan hydrolase-like protein with peptidoglycan-binding domain
MKRFLFLALAATTMLPMAVHAETAVNTNTNANLGATQAISGTSLSRAEIVKIQQALNSHGYYRGTADGVWGPNTASAIQRFQQSNQINANGNLDADTLDQLGVNLSMNSNASTNSAVSSEFENRNSKRGTSVNPGTGLDANTSADASVNSSSPGSDMGNPVTQASSPERRSIGGVDLNVGAAVGGND